MYFGLSPFGKHMLWMWCLTRSHMRNRWTIFWKLQPKSRRGNMYSCHRFVYFAKCICTRRFVFKWLRFLSKGYEKGHEKLKYLLNNNRRYSTYECHNTNAIWPMVLTGNCPRIVTCTLDIAVCHGDAFFDKRKIRVHENAQYFKHIPYYNIYLIYRNG